MKRKSFLALSAIACIVTIISLAFAQSSQFIGTFEAAHPVGSTCVMHYKDSSLPPLARVYIEESKQEFLIERVQNLFNFREARAAYDVQKGAERCLRKRNDAGKKRGFRL